MNTFLETPDDIQWLKDTCLRGVTLPTAWQGFRAAVIRGNEDAPSSVDLFLSDAPKHDDDYLRVTFDHPAPVYCEYAVYDGKTRHPR